MEAVQTAWSPFSAPMLFQRFWEFDSYWPDECGRGALLGQGSVDFYPIRIAGMVCNPGNISSSLLVLALLDDLCHCDWIV